MGLLGREKKTGLHFTMVEESSGGDNGGPEHMITGYNGRGVA